MPTARKPARPSSMKPGKGKTWTDKVKDTARMPVVKTLEKPFADMPAGARMLIATPAIIADYVRHIRKGRSVRFSALRQDLALQFQADYACPVTTGIFLRMVAEAAYEQWQQGKTRITPFWRVVEPDSALNQKLSFGPRFVAQQRKKEGI